ncbi:FAD binding domain-containing protein [Mycena vulgaris]|nr:FAD binding domain-containing protein [Mycena vulgaris]
MTLNSQYGEVKEVKARVYRRVRWRAEQRPPIPRKIRYDADWRCPRSAIDVIGFKTDFLDINKDCRKCPWCDNDYFPDHGDGSKTPSLEDVVAAIHKAFHPYTFSWDDWFTIYNVGQSIASKFDASERIFLPGDAAHLHSPKGGLGTNTSLMDEHNFAKKIALVEPGIAKPGILSTYALGRRMVITHLVQMDTQLIQIYADHGQSSKPEELEKLLAFQREHFAFQAGANITYITYGANLMVEKVSHTPSTMEKLVGTEGLVIGRRLLPASVKRLDAAPCDGRFTIFICVGDLSAPRKVEQLVALSDLLHWADGTWALNASTPPARRMLPLRSTGRLGLRTSSVVVQATKPVLFDTSALYSDAVARLAPHVDAFASAESTSATDILSIKATAGILLYPVHTDRDCRHAQAWMSVGTYFGRFAVEFLAM